MTLNDLRQKLINNREVDIETLDELIEVVTFDTDWDFAETKTLFLANFSTELP